MKEILLAVMAALKENVTDLQYVAEDYGQMDNYGEVPPVKFPCALISISGVEFEVLDKMHHRAKVSLTVRIADAPSLIGNMAAPESYRKRAFAIFDIIDKVGDSVQAISETGFGKVEELSVTRYQRDDVIREYAVSFMTKYIITD